LFSQYCADPFTVEAVEIEYQQPPTVATVKSRQWPDFKLRSFECSPAYINQRVGVTLSGDEIVSLISRMSHEASYDRDRDLVQVQVPVTRSDILHACDLAEDVAIAFGYNNLKMQMPATPTQAKQQPIGKLTDQLRHEIAMAGFLEVLTLTLCSRDENFAFLNHADDQSAVSLSNPASLEFQLVRTSLLPGMLKTVAHNRKSALPIKMFEISDIVRLSDETDVGAINSRHLIVLHCGLKSGFEVSEEKEKGINSRLYLFFSGCSWNVG
jgi:phenylalanyl-tRNA synthetase beta chain